MEKPEKAQGPFVRVPRMALEELSPTELGVWCRLVDHSGHDPSKPAYGVCKWGLRSLAAESRMGRTTVLDAIKRLEELGYVEVASKRAPGARWDHNEYKVPWSSIWARNAGKKVTSQPTPSAETAAPRQVPSPTGAMTTEKAPMSVSLPQPAVVPATDGGLVANAPQPPDYPPLDTPMEFLLQRGFTSWPRKVQDRYSEFIRNRILAEAESKKRLYKELMEPSKYK